MKPASSSPRLLRMISQCITCAAAGVVFACASLPALADQTDQQGALAQQFVTRMHADPLVAGCAAHGNFIAATSSAIDHVEFPPSSFDSDHASITPWNDAFDHAKQRVNVDTIVTVSGIGVLRSGDEPINLTFRCGYVNRQIIAFSWNDPVPAAQRVSHEPGARAGHRVCRGHGRHRRCWHVGGARRRD